MYICSSIVLLSTTLFNTTTALPALFDETTLTSPMVNATYLAATAEQGVVWCSLYAGLVEPLSRKDDRMASFWISMWISMWDSYDEQEPRLRWDNGANIDTASTPQHCKSLASSTPERCLPLRGNVHMRTMRIWSG
ncbi:hypothetical protein EJ02DRAFT_423434 [Clathrospora elynae]|uniref:Secreted protein n=1 Tax=Clathrospora elynae TaxID=706981 RepID=A0A6A5SVG1_9PLEO|nr:hypothetical protein EJ02DRAFT_423434 [Clathrospora elynae]